MITIALTALTVILMTIQGVAQQTVIFVRHAERADSTPGAPVTMAADPDLSDAGRARSESLAAMLKDAGIVAIVSTQYKRTQQTAAPLAKLLGIPVTTIKSGETEPIRKMVTSTTGNVLVVGHSNTIPDIIKALGAPPPPAIGDDEFDNLYLVTLGTAPSVVRLHYQK
jgi:broad specificity phosphatase PhoE